MFGQFTDTKCTLCHDKLNLSSNELLFIKLPFHEQSTQMAKLIAFLKETGETMYFKGSNQSNTVLKILWTIANNVSALNHLGL